jgi:hypothetical protein
MAPSIVGARRAGVLLARLHVEVLQVKGGILVALAASPPVSDACRNCDGAVVGTRGGVRPREGSEAAPDHRPARARDAG